MDTRELREFFKTGNSLGYDFRILQLKKLKASLTAYQDQISQALALDMSKPGYESYLSEISLINQELDHAIDNLHQWMKDEKVATPLYLKPGTSYVEKRPKGLVFIISPWNYPFLLTFSPLISSIAAGNCSIVKPSQKAQHSYRLIEEIIGSCFDSNYVAFFKEPSSQVLNFLRDQDLDHVFFTGSQAVGREIASLCAKNLTPFSLELGGKSPGIVDGTGDLALAAKKLTWAKFLNVGQTCIAPDYLLIKEDFKDEFVEMIIDQLKIFYGENIESSPDYGRLINQDRCLHLVDLLEESSLIYGGAFNVEDRFIEPSLVEAKLGDRIMQEEIFGPIWPILTYEDNSQLIDLVEANPNPLALYLFSENPSFTQYVLQSLSFGGGCINDAISQMANINLPFGGIRQSGSGSYHSHYGFYQFSHLRPILHTSKNIDIDIKYPPYTRGKKLLAKLILK